MNSKVHIRILIYFILGPLIFLNFYSCHPENFTNDFSKNQSFDRFNSDNNDTLLNINFNSLPTGKYALDDFNKDWLFPRWSQGLSEGRVEIVENSSDLDDKYLRIFYPKGKVGPWEGGAQWKLKLKRSYDELYCAYSVMFQNSFDFVLGGKLPGFVGGRGYTGGNRPDGKNGWSARMMWRRVGGIVQYVYHPYQRGKWGDDLPWKPGFLSSYSFEPGKWYTVEHHIKMNTPGKSDGLIEGWLNGQLALRETDFLFRDIPSLGIDAFYFSTFFGGQGPQWAPTKDEYIYFDNFVISTRPITH